MLVMAGLPTPTNVTIKPDNVTADLAILMQQHNYSPESISRYVKVLNTLTKRGAILTRPESVRDTINKQQWSNGTKQHARTASMLFLKFAHIAYDPEILPRYKCTQKMVFIPTENELDQLISGSKHSLATFLQTLKETAARYGEALEIKWIDFNTEANTLSINQPEKGSNPRTVRISNKLAIMLATLPRNTDKIFPYKNKEVIRRSYERARKRIAKNLANPRILQIHMHTFRHWRATTELHKTNNIWTVMKLLGHKNLNNTQRYIGLLPDLTDDYVTAIAHTTAEMQKLLENGYTYITNNGEDKIFTKRK
jgi:integrase